MKSIIGFPQIRVLCATAAAFVALVTTGDATAQHALASPEVLKKLKAAESDRVAMALQHLDAMRASLGLDSAHKFIARSTHTDEFGHTHTRFQQHYRGLKVWGGEAITHLDASGNAHPLTDALRRNVKVDTESKIGAVDALDRVTRDLNLGAEQTPLFDSELLIFAHDDRILERVHPATNASQARSHPTRYRLAYHVKATIVSPNQLAQYVYIIDAKDGRILAHWDDLHTAASIGVGKSQFSGTVAINTNTTATGFELRDTTRGAGGGQIGANAVVNMNNGSSGGSLYTDADNTWGDSGVFANSSDTASDNGQTAAVDAAYGLQATWDYYKNVHQRNGIDGVGTATYARVHYGTGYINAFWTDDCFCMTYGDGNGTSVLSFTSLDISGHELTHGVTSHTAGLIYSGESGGLNEANSDIHGTMVEFYVRGANATGNVVPDIGGNWLLGEQTFPPNGLRKMYKPSLDGLSADAWSEEIHKWDVHYSSGPMNRAFYFLSQGASADNASNYYSVFLPGGMTGIGNDKAARIWYRAMTTYLTSTSNYLSARQAALHAAVDLYGSNSAENFAVRKAFGAINVGNPDDQSDDFEAPVISVSAQGTSGIVALVPVATDNRAVTRVDYFVDGFSAGSVLSSPFVFNLDSTQLKNGNHQLSAKAYDAAGNVGDTSTDFVFSLTNDTQQLMLNPGSESPILSWTGANFVTPDLNFYGIPAHSGHYSMVYGGGLGTQWAFQRVTIPASTPYARLNVWLRIDTVGARDVITDTMTLQIRAAGAGDVPGAVLQTLDTYSNMDSYREYFRKSFDLSAYAGQTIEIFVEMNIPGAITSTFYALDDWSLVASTAPILDVQTSPQVLGTPPGGQQQFTAAVTGTANKQVTWSVAEGAAGGAISTDGIYTAPAIPGPYHVTATSVADPKEFSTALVLVESSPVFTSSANFSAPINTPNVTFTVKTSGVPAPFLLVAGQLPMGMNYSINRNYAFIYGTPMQSGTFQSTFTAKGAGAPVTQVVTITITGVGAQAPVLLSVVSRKVHGAAGTFDLPIDLAAPINGNVTIEPRAMGAEHLLIFHFDRPISSTFGFHVTGSDNAPVNLDWKAVNPSGNDVEFRLTNTPGMEITGATRLSIAFDFVNGLPSAAKASMGFLLGDIDGTGAVDASDISEMKKRSGQVATQENFKFDLNASGQVTAADIMAVKKKQGLALPP